MTYRRLLGLCFLLNGICLLGSKGITEFGFGRSSMYVLFWIYVTGALVNLIHVCTAWKPVSRQNILIGVMGGLGSVIGMGCAVTALNMIPGYVVFPLSQGGTLLLVALIGCVFFKEKIGPYGIAGIVSGIAAIVLLSIK